ncbi:MAG: DNA-processing protein DprA [Clostridia bacterium]|nr:DNA-processing protein DprA [Clostridia bacterium]
MKQLEYVWLSNLDISNRNKFQLMQKLGGIKELYQASLDDLMGAGIKDEIAYKVLSRDAKEKAERDLEYMDKNKIELINFEHQAYPEKFQKLRDKPVCFYVKGDAKILKNESVGIVGSRIALKESMEMARMVAEYFARRGINVISGLAKGIDKSAHLGALDTYSKDELQNGKTIGVLACGLDKNSFYPHENLKVYERIVREGGCVISEYPIRTIPKPYYFPLRNRLISGLSDKVFVIQASSLKSGSMITVDYALEQGKEVYVYQSPNIKNPYFEGNRRLIEEGAKIFKI